MNLEHLDVLFAKIIKEALPDVTVEILERGTWPAPPNSSNWDFGAGPATIELGMQYLVENIKSTLPADVQHIKVLNNLHLYMFGSFCCGVVYITPMPMGERDRHDE